MLQIQSPFQQLFDTNGSPLDDGYVYIGTANANPETSPISIYWDDAGTIPAAQPLRTLNGYIVRSGTPARVYTALEDFSMTVKDRQGRVVFSVLDATSDSNLTTALASSSGSSLVGFLQAGTGAQPRTVQSKLRDVVSVKDFGAVGDGVTNDTAALAAALAAVPANGTLYFPAGVYRGYLLIWRGDISIVGDSSASTKIKLPNNTPTITVPHDGPPNPITGLPNVIELGECALGNAANEYANIVIRGLTLDGNYTNNTAPTTDLFGHGLIATKISNLVIDDVVAENCFATGIDIVINSNYARVNARVNNCGNALIYGGRYPNFDINSSKYGKFSIISSGGYYGGRMLDNCWGNNIDISVYNPSITGFVYNNQTLNVSYANILNVTVVDGCAAGQGMSVGNNCYASQINVDIRNAASTGVLIGGVAEAYEPRGNTFNINTYGCSGASTDAGGINNQYNICSRYDGDAGAPGSVFAVDIKGDYNQFVINIEDQSTPQVRGVVVRAGAQYNNIIDYKCNTTVQDFVLQDTSNTTKYFVPKVLYSSNIGTWAAASLNAGWSNTFGSPYPAVAYTIDALGRVNVRGTVTGGTGTIFTLPAGFRPTATMLFPTNANGAMGRLSVDSSGVVTLAAGTATSVDLSPLTFYIF